MGRDGIEPPTPPADSSIDSLGEPRARQMTPDQASRPLLPGRGASPVSALPAWNPASGQRRVASFRDLARLPSVEGGAYAQAPSRPSLNLRGPQMSADTGKPRHSPQPDDSMATTRTPDSLAAAPLPATVALTAQPTCCDPAKQSSCCAPA